MARMMQNRLRRLADTPEDAPRDLWDCDDEPPLRRAPPERAPDDVPNERLDWLVRTIETEIIPRLMLAHQAPQPEAACEVEPREERFGATEVNAFAQLVLERDAAISAAHVQALRRGGASLESIYLDLLAPAARRLGAMWEADLCEFTEVTIGLWRLQQVLYDLSPAFQSQPRSGGDGCRALLAPAPGSQHTFGLFMVAEFFRRAGWQVLAQPAVSANELVRATREEWFDIVGLSVGSEVHIDSVASVILDVRKASLNPAVAVMVGGPVFVQHPELLAHVGADATAVDAPRAIQRAENLLAARNRDC